jgi:hypothetical protein
LNILKKLKKLNMKELNFYNMKEENSLKDLERLENSGQEDVF